MGAFRRAHGLRIDHVARSGAPRGDGTAAWIDKTPRCPERPAAHARSVIVQLA